MSEKVVSLTPLNNFDSDVELLKLGGKLCLRRAEDEELPSLLGKLTRDITPYTSLLEANFVLEDRIEPPSMKSMNNIVLALRLLKVGDLQALATFQLRGNRVLSLGIHGDLNRMILPFNPYFLKKEETADLIELWKRIQVMTPKEHLKFPLRKFKEAYDRSGLAYVDKIVDYMVALESLVFFDEKESIKPAGKVIGIAVGMLLGNNHNERAKIKKTLTRAYGVRNAIVHGNLKKLEKYKQGIKKLSLDVEEYLRRVLRKFIEE